MCLLSPRRWEINFINLNSIFNRTAADLLSPDFGRKRASILDSLIVGRLVLLLKSDVRLLTLSTSISAKLSLG